MYVSFDTFNDSVHLARSIAPEQPRRSDFDGSEPRIGCKDVRSPRWLMIRRLWAMLLPSSMMTISSYLYAAFTAEKLVLFFTKSGTVGIVATYNFYCTIFEK